MDSFSGQHVDFALQQLLVLDEELAARAWTPASRVCWAGSFSRLLRTRCSSMRSATESV
ncbi:MAG: hypothetical protein U5P41_10470 [Gammaproteobacteria bacterium]|nr:hypothetical protein [Gammaproteobacteria bacterium]